MRPISRKPKYSSNMLKEPPLGLVIGGIKGNVRKIGQSYSDAVVAIYEKDTLQPIAIRKPNANGDYQLLGLNTDLKTFIVAFDKKQQFNAVIQDNVVPK